MSGGPIPELEYGRQRVRGADYLVGMCGTGSGRPSAARLSRDALLLASRRAGTVATAPSRGDRPLRLRGDDGSRRRSRGAGVQQAEAGLDLVQLMDALELRRFAVVGHDRGASIQTESSGSPSSTSSRRSTSSSVPHLPSRADRTSPARLLKLRSSYRRVTAHTGLLPADEAAPDARLLHRALG